MVKLLEARAVGGYQLWVRFSDGTEGTVDLADQLQGPVFEPLREESFFAAARFDPEVGTVVWPNGADLAPEFLYARLKAAAA
jgi:hypothetical protein